LALLFSRAADEIAALRVDIAERDYDYFQSVMNTAIAAIALGSYL
jgi:hypothetical protein